MCSPHRFILAEAEVRQVNHWTLLTTTSKLGYSGWTYDAEQNVFWIRAQASNSALTVQIALQ